MTLFRRNNDVIALCVRWDRTTLPLRPRLHYIKHTVHWLYCSGCWFHLGSAYLHIKVMTATLRTKNLTEKLNQSICASHQIKHCLTRITHIGLLLLLQTCIRVLLRMHIICLYTFWLPIFYISLIYDIGPISLCRVLYHIFSAYYYIDWGSNSYTALLREPQ